MRTDMDKILVERPRVGHWIDRRCDWKGTKRAFQRAALNDELPVVEKINNGRARRWQRQLNENLAPLKRFLGQRIGRSWNSVYAEVSQNMNRNNPVQLHIFQHLEQYVEKNPMYVNGVACRPGWKGVHPLTRVEFYIDAQGILRRGEGLTFQDESRAAKKARQNAKEYVLLSDNKVAKKDVNGNWFEVTLAPVVKPKRDPRFWWIDPPGPRDVWHGTDAHLMDGVAFALYGKAKVFAVSKRAMNSKEIAALPK